MRAWVAVCAGLVLTLGAGRGGAAEQNAMPAFNLVSPSGVSVASTAISNEDRWVLVYVSTACGSCDRLLSALEQWRPTLPPGRVVVVIRGSRESAHGYATRHGDAAGMAWFADAEQNGARALGLDHEPALIAIENGRVGWTVTGVLNDPQAIEPIIRNWTIR